MPRTSSPRRKRPSNTAARTTTPSLPTLTRTQANQKLRERAAELYHLARNEREDRIAQFESEYGRTDRIDAPLLSDLQRLQVRFAAIAARQTRTGSTDEPKISRFTRALGEIVGDISAHIATERALELFAPISEREYIGIGGIVGSKGLDESVLAGFQIIDDPKGPQNVMPTKLDDQDVCLHAEIEPLADDPTRSECLECGQEFKSSSVAAAA